jgi:hypothetical protein
MGETELLATTLGVWAGRNPAEYKLKISRSAWFLGIVVIFGWLLPWGSKVDKRCVLISYFPFKTTAITGLRPARILNHQQGHCS